MDPGRRALSDAEIGVLRSTMEQAVEEQLLILDKRSLFLATAVSASPFLGLFGTVWGITLAFTNLAIMGKADIQTLAPGVSGALLTTVIALIVAIPSLVGYNMIGAFVRKLTVKLDNFVEEIASRLKIEQMDSIAAAARMRNAAMSRKNNGPVPGQNFQEMTQNAASGMQQNQTSVSAGFADGMNSTVTQNHTQSV